MYKICVLLSGAGSTFNNLALHCYKRNGLLNDLVDIKSVVADRKCYGLSLADRWSTPNRIVLKKDYPNLKDWSNAIFSDNVDLFVFAGFLSKVVVPDHLAKKVINIHPSLLPAYGGKDMYGINVHEAVIKNKEKWSGCTVHYVDNEYDHGEIIAQERIEVLEGYTASALQHSVQEAERRLYPKAILDVLGVKVPEYEYGDVL